MKIFKLLSLLVLFVGCNNLKQPTETINQEIDIASELAAIEETRSAFESAIKEGRYQDLQKYTTADVKTVGPGSPEWIEMRRLGQKSGQFAYDSIIMRPTETIIVSDTIAYDFGTSSVYYTDAEGNSRELKDTFLAIIKKDKDGVWKLHREVASATIK